MQCISEDVCVSTYFVSNIIVDEYSLHSATYDQLLYEASEIIERSLQMHSQYDRQLCDISECVEVSLKNYIIQCGHGMKRRRDAEASTSNQLPRAGAKVQFDSSTSSPWRDNKVRKIQSKREPGVITSNLPTRVEEENKVQSESSPVRVECEVCKVLVNQRYYHNHVKSKFHKNNILKRRHLLSNVNIIESAFGCRIVTYRITSPNSKPSNQCETPETFINSVADTILFLIRQCIKELTIFKVNFILHAEFIQQSKNILNTFDFQTFNYTLCLGDELNTFMASLKDMISNKIGEFEKKDSGWSLKEIQNIDMNVNKFDPLRGSSYIKLPLDVKYKKAVINVRNNDSLCFKWALLSGLYPTITHSDRVSSYVKYSHKLNFSNISFPIKINDIYKVEKLNNISINVFGLEYSVKDKCHRVVGPLYFTKSRRNTHINLLYITEGKLGHYCFIKNLSRLVSRQLSLKNGAVFICDGCLLHFSTHDRLLTHQSNDCIHIRVDLPNIDCLKRNWFGDFRPNNILTFDSFERKIKIPFVVYADFEAFLKPIDTCVNDPNKSYTINSSEHNVYSFGYYIKCSYDDRFSKFKTYSGNNCAKVFMESLYEDLKIITKKMFSKKSPLPLSIEDKLKIKRFTNNCYICNRNILLDHEDHGIYYDCYTGVCSGIAHNDCINKFQVPRFVPIILHNLSNYDAHFIVHALDFVEGEVNIIPQTKEKYISFSKRIKMCNNTIDLRFIDSYKFLSSSLDNLANNLNDDDFCDLRKVFPLQEDFSLIRRKGVFPYEYITSFESLKLESLPEHKYFYSTITNSNVSIEDFSYAQDVWKHFKCQSMSDYSNLYLKIDVLLLVDIFENFRNVCLATYDLDPAHYYTAPGLSWDSMLKYTGIELELLTDFDKISFVKSGIRGGVAQCSNRHAKANNKYMSNYNKNEIDSYLIYLDANNLYGWAMSQYLPIGEFEWVESNIDFNVSDTSNIGYILEVDLEYPDCIHDLHSDLPLCAENIRIGNAKDCKLVPNLNNKTKYIIHYRNLKQCLEMGMELSKVHRVLKFKQSPWLRNYIDLNTRLRTSACNNFQKDFYKLMNNSVFGKTMENVEKRVNVKLVTHWYNSGRVRGAQTLISQPEFHSLSIFSENLVAVQLNKLKIFYNKPIYLGFCILDLSKTLMYDFHYKYMKKKFQNNLKLLYTDTDSLIYQIFTKDYYEDIKPDLYKYFDTSDYPIENMYNFPLLNKKKLGFFKDENSGQLLLEFVGLRAKMYAVNVEGKFTAKAKGVNKSVTKKMNMEDYKTCLFNKNIQMSEMYRFKSIKHAVYTQKINKICLSYDDTKRHVLPNSTDTISWGHYSLRHQ